MKRSRKSKIGVCDMCGLCKNARWALPTSSYSGECSLTKERIPKSALKKGRCDLFERILQ